MSDFDHRHFERRRDNAVYLIMNPPSPEALTLKHSEYRRQANDALNWLQKNFPEDYEECAAFYVNYVQENTPQQNATWSNGQYTHQYSYGAPDGWSETAMRVVAAGVDKFTSACVSLNEFMGDDDEKRVARNRSVLAHNRRVVNETHEEIYRARMGLPDTPPASPRSYE